MKKINRTSLYESHINLNAKMVEFAGYLMPIQYNDGIQSEYISVRNNVGLFDVSHMGVFEISGNKSDKFLNNILSNNILKLGNNKAMYTLLCNNEGGVIDDLIIYKLDNKFILIVNASNKEKDFKWINDNNSLNKEIQINDISASTSLIALQGPNSKNEIEKLFNINLDIDFYSCKKIKYIDEDILIARTGYTGELGFEILGSHNVINNIWNEMISNDAPPIGLAVRDILRIEMGYCLYGHEIDEDINPLDARLGWVLDKESNFIGYNEINNIKKQKNKLIFLKTLERGIPRQGFDIYVNDQKAGFVTSGTFSYLMRCGLGIGFINRDIDKYDNASLLVRDKKINIDISSKPFMFNRSLRK